MENKNTTISISVLVVVLILLGAFMYAKQTPQTNTGEQNSAKPSTPPEAVRYPKYYPPELAFDLSKIDTITDAKDANGKLVLTITYTSVNPISDFTNLVRTILSVKKWSITDGATGDKPAVIKATRGTEVVTVNLTESGKGTAVKIDYQR